MVAQQAVVGSARLREQESQTNRSDKHHGDVTVPDTTSCQYTLVSSAAAVAVATVAVVVRSPIALMSRQCWDCEQWSEACLRGGWRVAELAKSQLARR
jgi:hypothetical protein